MALTIAFVRRRGGRDRAYVTRGDAASTFWDFPTYGDRLPHDLCHLVVEEGLGIGGGFWGLVDRGVEVRLVDNQATLVFDGSPLVERPGFDFSDLLRAEAAVAALGPAARERGIGPPEGTTPAQVDSIRRRLDDLGRRWRALGDGEAITLTYAGGRSPGPGHRS